jgi:superfamily II DNA or RNA helicase
MSFTVGSLVKARGREWVVLPASKGDLLILRPLGGTDDEIAGVHRALEDVAPARFELPDPTKLGDHRSSRLLRDAVRLGFRSSAGPFRSFGKIAVEPRPYQLVPLLMALKQDPVRLLIADDVGIGKTIEAGLIARELIDRAEVNRMAVLCPPHLAEQWQTELRTKFHIEAELVLPGTASRLDRNLLRAGQSLFEVYPFVIVSMDFIKSERRRDEFLRTCPELVIVDEAHTCADTGEGRGNRHQRHNLIKDLAKNRTRHLVLVTATPHSGNEGAFRSLLTILEPSLKDLPDDLSGQSNEGNRRRLAQYFVQRRRGDIRHYMQADTPFPERFEKDEAYSLTPAYRRLFEKVLEYARETVTNPSTNQRTQRVRWWSALALLRSLASSPAAAASTLRNRAVGVDSESVEEVNLLGRHAILDLSEDESVEGIDLAPGSDYSDAMEGNDGSGRVHRRLLDMAKEADALHGANDSKLSSTIGVVKELLEQQHNPIVFCRFIPTAEYVAAELRKKLPKDVEVIAVTGLLPHAEREARVLELGQAEKRVLVATDCLSEGINLQEHFDAVVHYDLSWNPTRHEQREGRVDRYGQPNPNVRMITCYGTDNQIDGIVLDVLIKKHRSIRKALGVSVPMPMDNDLVVQAIIEGLLLRANPRDDQMALFEMPIERRLENEWQIASDREKRSRTMFAQEGIKVDEVARELAAVQAAVGSGVDVRRFVLDALRAHNATVTEHPNGSIRVDASEAPRALRDAIQERTFTARFQLPVRNNELYLNRTHPIVEGLAQFVMDSALDSLEEGVARRCGVIRTSSVGTRTTMLLTRFRYHLISERNDEQRRELLAEDCQLLSFEGAPSTPPDFLGSERSESLLEAQPDENVNPDQARDMVSRVIEHIGGINERIEAAARTRGEELLEAHKRVRSAANITGLKQRIVPQLPPDVLSITVLLPAPIVALAAD